MAKYNNLKLGTFLKKPPTEFLLSFNFVWWSPNQMVGEENSNGSWQRWKKNLGEGCKRCQIIHLSLINLSNCFNHNHTPPLNFFFIFGRTRQKYFLCYFYWGPISHICKVAKTPVGGFLRKLWNFKKRRKHQIFKN